MCPVRHSRTGGPWCRPGQCLLVVHPNRIRVPHLQLGNGGVQVGLRLLGHLFRGLLLPRPCPALLLPASVREGARRFTPPGTPQGVSVAAHHDAHRRVLVQGGGHHATTGAGAGLVHGRRNCARRLLRRLLVHRAKRITRIT